MALTVYALTGCHFGDAKDELYKLSIQTRKLSYSVTIGLPSGTGTQDSIIDLGPEGLKVNFGPSADFAIMGKEFQSGESKSAVWPNPEVLSYHYYQYGDPVYEDGVSKLSFDYTAYGKHGVGEDYATAICYFYPAGLMKRGNGSTYKARVDSIPLDFTGQDGKLISVRRRYFPALGMASAVCSKSQVVMRDSARCLAGHDHVSSASQMVLLDSKVAIVRLSLVVPAQEDYPLLQYLQSQAFGNSKYYIDQIEIINRQSQPAGISKVNLNLQTGWMEASPISLSGLILKDGQRFRNHDQIMRESPQLLDKVGGQGATWGTLIYVAFPCTQQGYLDMDLDVVVHIGKMGESVDQNYCLYGSVQSIELREGCYYISSPVMLYREKDKIGTSAQIYRVP